MRPAESFIGQPIRSLQTMLRVLSEYDDSYLPLVPDGIYGPETMAAVTHFQRKHGLPATGVTNQATWEAVVAEYEPALVSQGPAQLLEVVLNPGRIIRGGETDPVLYIVQSMLLVMARFYGSIGTPTLSGTLDAPTADALSSFQRLSGLPMSGQLNKMTWKHLSLQYPLAVDLMNRSKDK